MLKREVERAATMTQRQALAQRHLTGVGVYGCLNDPWRVAAAGVHLDHAVRHVAILDTGYSCNDLHALYVGRGNVAG